MKTTATTTEVWAIVIVAVLCLAFWLVMVVGIAPRPRPDPMRRRSSRWMPLSTGTEESMTPLGRLGPVVGGSHVAEGGRSVAPRRDAPAMAMAGAWGTADRGEEAEPGVPASGAAGTEVTRDDTPTVQVPGQRTRVPSGRTTSGAEPGGATARSARETPDPGVQWTREEAPGQSAPGVPQPRESATDQPARSRWGRRHRGHDRDH